MAAVFISSDTARARREYFNGDLWRVSRSEPESM